MFKKQKGDLEYKDLTVEQKIDIIIGLLSPSFVIDEKTNKIESNLSFDIFKKGNTRLVIPMEGGVFIEDMSLSEFIKETLKEIKSEKINSN